MSLTGRIGKLETCLKSRAALNAEIEALLTELSLLEGRPKEEIVAEIAAELGLGRGATDPAPNSGH